MPSQLNMAGSCGKRKCLNNDYKSIELAQKLCIDAAMKKESDRSCQRGFFDVEIIDSRTVDGVIEKKVRYVGYGEKYDEWLPAYEVVRTSRLEPKKFSQVVKADLARIRIRIKEGLSLSRRMDTIREVNEIVMPETWEVFSGYLEKSKVFPKLPTVFSATEESMSALLNDKSWGKRIINCNGDTAAINMATLQVTAYSRKPLPDYCEINGALVLYPISRGINMKFRFVVESVKHFS